MTSTDKQLWHLLGHDLIFEKIMLLIGHSSLEDLDRCRLVCKTWNDKIIMKIWKNPTKRWGAIIQRRIERSWDGVQPWRYREIFPSNAKISEAKLLGKHIHRINIVVIIKAFYFSNQRHHHPGCVWHSGKESQRRDIPWWI